LLLGSVAWGALGALTVSQHASGARDVVSVSEPLSLSAQQMYQSLSDADVTATTEFLTSPTPSLSARDRYQADLGQAATDLTTLAAAPATASSRPLLTSLNAISTGLRAYDHDVTQAQDEYALGYLLTGGSFMQVATEEMHLTLLPAARAAYAQENARLVASSARATGLPLITATFAFALAIAFVLFRSQRWLSRHTHRRVNYGLLTVSLILTVGVLWLVVAFVVARADLHRGIGHGSTPAEALAQAAIDTQQIRGDEIVNLISRSGDATFLRDFRSVQVRLGPGPGTLLTGAVLASPSGAGAQWAVAAARDVQGWYGINNQAYHLDPQYSQETQLVIGPGPATSTAGFERVEGDLGRAIAADQVIFRGSATAGENAFTGLEAGIIVTALLMAIGCARGLEVRLAEYR
jgi:hypothetical protein